MPSPSDAQFTTLRADLQARIAASPAGQLAQAVQTADDQGTAAFYNAPANPDFWVWKSSLTFREMVESTVDTTQFSWPAFIGRSQGERDAFVAIFIPGFVNPSQNNVRQAFADIFSGASGQAQLAYLTAVGRRKANLIEKLLAVGNGTPTAPAVAAFEGQLTISDAGRLR